MHDRDATHDLIHTNVPAPFELHDPALARLDHCLHLPAYRIAHLLDGLEACHLVPDRGLARRQVLAPLFEMRLLRMQRVQERREGGVQVRQEDGVEVQHAGRGRLGGRDGRRGAVGEGEGGGGCIGG